MTSLVPRKRDRQTDTHSFFTGGGGQIELLLQLPYLWRKTYSRSPHETYFSFYIYTLFRNIQLQENQFLLYGSTKTGSDTVIADDRANLLVWQSEYCTARETLSPYSNQQRICMDSSDLLNMNSHWIHKQHCFIYRYNNRQHSLQNKPYPEHRKKPLTPSPVPVCNLPRHPALSCQLNVPFPSLVFRHTRLNQTVSSFDIYPAQDCQFLPKGKG